jgi:cell fate (sporulation/competence/biofilm development) regulator YlbF (YheA/YmcA/DUF963 family)
MGKSSKSHESKKIKIDEEGFSDLAADIKVNGVSVNESHLLDGSGRLLASFEELKQIPLGVRKINLSDGGVKKAIHLASDMLKGGISVPGKTIRIVFKPEIAQGLRDGTYTLMRDKSGGVLADAVNSANKIAGKGRIVQAGQAAQIFVGAYQIVSIAVAQSHLAEISRAMNKLHDGVAEIIQKLEIADKSNITGTISYLTDLAEKIRSSSGSYVVSSEKSHVIEQAVRDTMTWRDKLFFELEELIQSAEKIENKDTFGTAENHKYIMDFVKKYSSTIDRNSLLMQLISLENMLIAYLDPLGQTYTNVRFDHDRWSHGLDNFSECLRQKIEELLGSSIITSDELLNYRRRDAIEFLDHSRNRGVAQIQEFKDVMEKLDQTMKNLLPNGGEVKLALSYDDGGEIREAALID